MSFGADVSFGGDLSFGGDVSFGGNVSFGGDVSFSGDMSFGSIENSCEKANGRVYLFWTHCKPCLSL